MDTDMATEDLSRELPAKPSLPVVNLFARVLETIKPYRESIVLIVTLGVAAVGLNDYFITRLDVRILNCRSLAQLRELN